MTVKKVTTEEVGNAFVPPETLFFVDASGVYLGGFSGVEPPTGAIQVPLPPGDARQLWDFQSGSWGPIPPAIGYTIGADVPWSRMDEDEAVTVQDTIDAKPVKIRNMINKASSFTEGTEAFSQLKAIIAATLSATRANEIMAPLSIEEMAASLTEVVR